MRHRILGLLLIGIAAAGCSEGTAVHPSALAAGTVVDQEASSPLKQRPLKGHCVTSFAPVAAPSVPGVCPMFQSTPSAFVSITGHCEISHLGRSTVEATQQLVFALDRSGQPLIIAGQPLVREVRNCGTFTAANGDRLHHTAVGPSRAGEADGTVAFSGSLTFTGGTGRFVNSRGSAELAGGATLASSTGEFWFAGGMAY